MITMDNKRWRIGNTEKAIEVFRNIMVTEGGRQFYMHKDNKEDIHDVFIIIGPYRTKGNEDFVKLKKRKNWEMVYYE